MPTIPKLSINTAASGRTYSRSGARNSVSNFRVARHPLRIANSPRLSDPTLLRAGPSHNYDLELLYQSRTRRAQGCSNGLRKPTAHRWARFEIRRAHRLFMTEGGQTPRCHQVPIATRGSKLLPTRIRLGRRNSRSTLPMIFPLPRLESRLRLTERAE